jgi:uncharacterized protein
MTTSNQLIEESATESGWADGAGGAVAPDVDAKEKRLVELLHEMESVVVAFSGGVDSTYVAYVAARELGERALSVTGESASLAQDQRTEIAQLVERFGFRHETLQTEELADPRYLANASNRCYFCKSELYGKLAPRAQEEGYKFVVDGSTLDDLGDFRPGRTAANEYGVRSPLIEAGMTKNDVRELSRRAGLPTWDKPASPCLSSRIAYGLPVTIERLSAIDRGEAIMREMGFREFRVRHHDQLVRLEIAPAEMMKALSAHVVDEFARRFRELGFKYVTLDLHGYRTGAMNEVLNKKPI